MDERVNTGPAELAGSPAEVVRAVWAHVLGEESFDAETGFFDLGATSVDVLRAVERLRVRWPGLRVVDVFLHPTVAALAAFVEG
jgi:aryl carrier-like protein